MRSITIHQVWLQGQDEVPAVLRPCMRTWVDAADGRDTYDYACWDDAAVRRLLRDAAHPRLGAIYDAIPVHVHGMRADVARLVVLYERGGLYADADTRVLRPAALLDYFERTLLHERADAVVGTSDLPGLTRAWTQATRRPSNYLLACRPGSTLIGRYLDAIVRDFDARRIEARLARHRGLTQLTKRWTGPKQLRKVLRTAPRSNDVVRTPLGFVASGRQRCFPHAALAHEYRSGWYRASRIRKTLRDWALHDFLDTRIDAVAIAVLLLLMGLASL